MKHKEEKENNSLTCFICKSLVENPGEAEMIIGPNNKKVLVHDYHSGVDKEVKEEYSK